MIDKLSTGTFGDLIAYRLQRAHETLKEADYNAQGDYYNAANNLGASSHKGIKTMLGLKFITTGLLEPKYGRIYQQLFENRQSGDYEDFVYCDKELYEMLRPQAEDFVNKISQMLCR